MTNLREDFARLENLKELEKVVCFFGSARFKQDDFYYKEAKKLASICVNSGLCVLSGGGVGIMQAANEGAMNAINLSENEISFKKNSKGENSAQIPVQNQKNSQIQNRIKSAAFSIFLPFESKVNDFVEYNCTFKSLAIRKMALIQKSLAFVIFPGGFGTLDELCEVLALRQLGFKKAPIFLIGKEFWQGFNEFVKVSLLKFKLINPNDVLSYEITDDLEFVIKKILKEIDENSSRNERRS